MKIPNDVIIQAAENGRWILYNVFSQTTIAITTQSLELLSKIQSNVDLNNILEQSEAEFFYIWDIEWFSNYNGLLAEPTRRIRDLKKWPKPHKFNAKEFIFFLQKKYFIIDDEQKYSSIFGLKNSIIDNEHLGNFHQQLGKILILEKKEDPDTWWLSQKFDKDQENLNDNLYRAIQENFLKNFFENRFNSTHKILDLGCGIGYYSNLMSNTGAQIIGVDPNKKFIEIAKIHQRKNTTFHNSEIGKRNSLSWIESKSMDYIFMSDALLFYFVSPDPKEKLELKDLFSEIKRILKPGGRFFSLEPHGLFFLRPWLGEANRPFTIITEYTNRWFNIVPNFSEMIQTFIKNNFIIRDIKELTVSKDFLKKDKRATNFAAEFPLWWFFELEPEK